MNKDRAGPSSSLNRKSEEKLKKAMLIKTEKHRVNGNSEKSFVCFVSFFINKQACTSDMDGLCTLLS